jgi:hypothetical protein
MRFGQICAPLVTKDANNSPWLKQERKNEGHSSEPTLHGGHEMALPQLPAVTQESYTII